ncbi:hypothetical protein [Streptomyces sp. KS 21]|uniref:hypothetical protein n=1 Tax=Streptomyces sp. KS 21 TaxID=2485150 RepID=UPI0010D2A4E6|nr:hypothetical protein [Streptomyces sp. KS 21]TDU67982.1 hypothetical protein EDD91_8045 [Streptomyces sp. KS 21]
MGPQHPQVTACANIGSTGGRNTIPQASLILDTSANLTRTHAHGPARTPDV